MKKIEGTTTGRLNLRMEEEANAIKQAKKLPSDFKLALQQSITIEINRHDISNRYRNSSYGYRVNISYKIFV